MALEYEERRSVDYGVREYFDMVMDVDRYEDFLPYCTSSRVLERRVGGEMLAKMVLSFCGMRKGYTSLVKGEEVEVGVMRIDVSQYGRGPFSVLRNEWLFRSEGEGCCIDFRLEMGLGSVFLEKVVGGILEDMGSRMVEAFEGRARELYG